MTHMIDAQLHFDAVLGGIARASHHARIIDQNVQTWLFALESTTILEKNGKPFKCFVYILSSGNNHLLSGKISNRLKWCQITFSTINMLIFRSQLYFLACLFASDQITARHINVSLSFGQFQCGFFSDSRVGAGYDDNFAVGLYLAGVSWSLH